MFVHGPFFFKFIGRISKRFYSTYRWSGVRYNVIKLLVGQIIPAHMLDACVFWLSWYKTWIGFLTKHPNAKPEALCLKLG